MRDPTVVELKHIGRSGYIPTRDLTAEPLNPKNLKRSPTKNLKAETLHPRKDLKL